MKLEIGEKLHGFEITNIRALPEAGGDLVEMRHEKTGAGLCYMNNGENNKLFSIAFETLPEDHTGVFHILEHSVLCGSDKFPIKEPFVELIKSSMNTFLNAMTFPDKTMYPVSSRNEKDFLNLTRVYLDAVFNPAILHNPSIFAQEGHHIEFNDAGEPLYKGVVFNEMKGVISSVDEAVEINLMDMIYPESPYRFVSGGHPEHIPDLTYEQFVDTYRRFYHPSNAKVWLDGAVPLDEVLEIIDREYFSKYEKSDNLPELHYQSVVPACAREAYYEVSADESLDNKAQIVFGRLIGDWREKEDNLALDIISDVLAGTNDAPLKRAILSAGLAQDLSLTVYDGIGQPFYGVRVYNTEVDKENEIRRVIRETVKAQVEKGLDSESLEASLNQLEFRVLESSEPQGLNRCINAMNAWLYGGDPAMYLTWKETFDGLRAKIGTGYYEKLLADILLDEDKLCTLRLLPSHTLGESRRKLEAKRLENTVAAWTDEDKAANDALNEALTAWQTTPDSPEALATIPTLELSEVDPEPALHEFTVNEENSIKVLRHEAACGGITHLVLYFDISNFTADQLKAVSLLPTLLGDLPTASHNAVDLQRLTKKYIGRLNYNIDIFADRKNIEDCTPYLTVTASFLSHNRERAYELIREVLTETRFDEKDKIKEIILQEEDCMRQSLVSRGHVVSMTRALAHFSVGQTLKDTVGGYDKYNYVKALATDFDAKIDAAVELFERVKSETVCRSRVTASVTCSDAANADISAFLGALPAGERADSVKYEKLDASMAEGIKAPSQISYASLAHDLNAMGIAFDGSANVLSNILSYGALWSKVRVQGGAYGSGIVIRTNGNIACYSYRDPSAARTLGIYRALANDLAEFCESDEKIDKYIISTIASTEPVRSYLAESNAADAEWFCGIDAEYKRNLRREMLCCTKAGLMRWSEALRKFAEDGAVCVIGYEDILESVGDLEIKSL